MFYWSLLLVYSFIARLSSVISAIRKDWSWSFNAFLNSYEGPNKVFIFVWYDKETSKKNWSYPASIYLFNIIDVVLVPQLLTLNRYHALFSCSLFGIWTSKCQLGVTIHKIYIEDPMNQRVNYLVLWKLEQCYFSSTGI